MGKKNRIFALLLVGSLLIHLIVYSCIGDLYSSNMHSVLEISLADIAERPEAREIPRPKFRPKLPPMPQDIVRGQVSAIMPDIIRTPHVEPPGAPLPENLTADINTPAVPSVPQIEGADFNTAGYDSGGGQFGSAREYFDMVRLKIESRKKYPKQARAMRREGRVTVIFIIEPSGNTRELKVKRSSGNSQLDNAALQAIVESSPLPMPPRAHFSGDQPVELTIVFELL